MRREELERIAAICEHVPWQPARTFHEALQAQWFTQLVSRLEQLHGGTVDSCGDHRIAMCAAVAATRCAGEVTILHGECVEKSYPRFYEDYRQLGGIANVIVLES